MIFALRLSLRSASAWAYAILWFPPTEIASDTKSVVVFFLQKTQKHNDQMFLCLFSTIGLHQTAYVFLCFFLLKNTKTQWPNVSLSSFRIRIAPDSLCVLVFLCCCFFRKTQKNWPNLFGLFFNNKIAPERQCVFVFFFRRKKNNQMCFCLLFSTIGLFFFQCVFVFFPLQKTQNTMTKFFCLFFSNRIAPESQCVCVFLCYFSENTKTPNVFVFFQQFHKNTLFIY